MRTTSHAPRAGGVAAASSASASQVAHRWRMDSQRYSLEDGQLRSEARQRRRQPFSESLGVTKRAREAAQVGTGRAP